MAGGKLFQMLDPATANDLSPLCGCDARARGVCFTRRRVFLRGVCPSVCLSVNQNN